jgi:drug/metabolite transporter (DMT)-like permease
MPRVGTLRCLAAAVLFGASAPAASVLAHELSPLVLAGLLYLGAALAVAPAVARTSPTREALRAGWRTLAVAVVAGGAIGPVLLVAGLARLDAATASILLNLELVATVILATTLFGEHLGGRVLAGAGLVTAGGVLLVWEPGAQWNAGGLLIAGACVCWGLDNCVTARIDQLGPEVVVLTKGAVAGTATLILGLVLALGTGTSVAVSDVAVALAVGALGYGVSITLWVKGARDLGAARAQVSFATAPFIGAVIAWAMLDGNVSAAQIAAAALAGAGIVVSLESAHEHRHGHQPVTHQHEHTHPEVHHEHPHEPAFRGRHSHVHTHAAVTHTHPHVPDLHHHHTHG